MADSENDTDSEITASTALAVAEGEERPCLILLSSPRSADVGAVYRLEGTATIGRSAEVQIHVEDHGVSRAHARVVKAPDGRYRVEDLDSRNGTHVNGVRMSQATLADGDRIQIGSATILRFSLREVAPDSAWLRQALEAARVATFQLDVATGVVRWSEQLDSMLGLTRGTFADHALPLLEQVHAEDRERLDRAMRGAAESGKLLNTEFRLAPREGQSLRWISCKGDVVRDLAGIAVRITGTVMDVTEQKRAEEELRRLALIFENLYDGVVTTDSEGRIVDWNASAERMFGHPRSEVLGKTLASVLRPSEAAPLGDAILKKISKEGRWTGELEFLRPDGTPGFCEAAMVPLKDATGKQLGFVATHRDISERKKLQAQLMLAERLASVGTLAAGVAHEINNPLAYISANLEFLLTELEHNDATTPERIQELMPSLRESLEGARRIAIIVRDLKTFSRGSTEAGDGPVNVQKAVELACKMASNIIRHRARLVLDFAQVAAVEGNEGRLCQVFLNLLVNAAESLPESSPGDAEIRVTVRPQGDLVAIRFQDSGMGMSPETLARIFDPFFTTKPVGVGTGLGLSICHGIVSSFGGRIQVESEQGKGSTFTVLLRQHHGVPNLTPAPVTKAPETSRRRVLVIDDELNVTLALQRVLGLSHDVAAVNSAREGLKLLESGERYDIILLDVMMPEMSGVELHTLLQRRLPDQAARVVFMTGGAFAPRTRNQLDQVANAKLTKPLDIAKVLSLVDGRTLPAAIGAS